MNLQEVMSLVLGFFIGTYGTLVGAGGGFLLVPLFLLLYHLPHEIAVGTSITIVAANAWSGALRYMQQRKVDYRMGIVFAVATLPGAFLGVYLTEYFSGPWFQRIFGVLLILISAHLIFRKKMETQSPLTHRGWGTVQGERRIGNETVKYTYSEPKGIGVSVAVGGLSSWLGIGGGILHVPLMTIWLGIPVHVATATSHFILAWTALAGAISHAIKHNVNYSLAVWIAAGAIIGAQVGAIISDKIKGSNVLRYLSIALFLVGVRLLFV